MSGGVSSGGHAVRRRWVFRPKRGLCVRLEFHPAKRRCGFRPYVCGRVSSRLSVRLSGMRYLLIN